MSPLLVYPSSNSRLASPKYSSIPKPFSLQMEAERAISEMNWSSSFDSLMSSEDVDFMAQLVIDYPFLYDNGFNANLGHPPAIWSSHEAMEMVEGVEKSTYCASHELNSSLYSWPQGNEDPISEQLHHSGDSSGSLIDLCVMDEQNTTSKLHAVDNLLADYFCFNADISDTNHEGFSAKSPEQAPILSPMSQPKRKFQMLEPEMSMQENNSTNSSENQKSSPWGSEEIRKTRKNGQMRKNQKLARAAVEEDNNAGLDGQSSCSYTSEDDSNTVQELIEGASSASKGPMAPNLNGKRRGSRGSATDPQSLYARKRRERINERLRILQNLVPNGTKVDISTMLEEAVQYVKFLQQQIKLLSSDDMWMYAPIAYNGMDLGLNLKFPTAP